MESVSKEELIVKLKEKADEIKELKEINDKYYGDACRYKREIDDLRSLGSIVNYIENFDYLAEMYEIVEEIKNLIKYCSPEENETKLKCMMYLTDILKKIDKVKK